MDYYSRRQRVWVVAIIVGHGENLQSASLGTVCFSYSSQGPLFIEEGSEGVIVDVGGVGQLAPPTWALLLSSSSPVTLSTTYMTFAASTRSVGIGDGLMRKSRESSSSRVSQAVLGKTRCLHSLRKYIVLGNCALFSY